MPRGKRPAAAIRDAKKFAEQMGYRSQENTDDELAYDLFIFKPEAAALVYVRQTRYHIDPDTFYEDILKDELREFRGIPFPPWIPRELWLRTQHERTWRRLMVIDAAVSEIGWWGPDGYVNPHAR